MSLDIDRYTLAQNRKRKKEESTAITDKDITESTVTKPDEVTKEEPRRRLPYVNDDVASTDSSVDVDYEMGGSTTVSTKDITPVDVEPAPRKKPTPRAQPGRSETAQIRDFPRELLDIARSEFPQATTQTDALAAYVCVKSGSPVNNLSDSVKQLVSEYTGDQTLVNIEDRMNALELQMRSIGSFTQAIELGVSFIIYDRLGFRLDNPTNIANIDMLEGEMADLITRLRSQAKKARVQENIKRGRQIAK